MLENLGQVLPFGAKKYGDKTALVIGSRSFSFNDLNHLSDRLASGLHGLGITAGDRVTLYAQNCWEWIVSYYAIARLGAVVNPINVMLTPEEVAYVVSTVSRFVEQTSTAAVCAAPPQSSFPGVPSKFQEAIDAGAVREGIQTGTYPGGPTRALPP